jgi:hypothetical protein
MQKLLLLIVILLLIPLPVMAQTDLSVFEEGQVGVIVADFVGEVQPHVAILDVLQSADLPGVQVVSLGRNIEDGFEAQEIGDATQATIVIYGDSTPDSVTANYEVTARWSDIYTEVEDELRLDASRLKTSTLISLEAWTRRMWWGLSRGSCIT